VNTSGHSVFSLAVSAFPTVSHYLPWLQFLSEIYGCSLSQAGAFPYDQMSDPPRYFTISKISCSLDFRPIPTSIPFYSTNPCEQGTEYAQNYIDNGKEQICPLEVAASLSDPALLLWLLEETAVDANWMSAGKPLWLRFLQLRVPIQAWTRLQDVIFSYRSEDRNSSACCVAELSVLDEERRYRYKVCLWEALLYPEAIYPLTSHIEALKIAYPDTFTDHYMALVEHFYPTSRYYSSSIRTAKTDQLVLGSVLPLLDCVAKSYRKFLYKRIDETIKNGDIEAFKSLLKYPAAEEFVRNPYDCSFPLGISSELALADLIGNYNENVNADFIFNSYLYFTLTSSTCSSELLTTLLGLGCPLINPNLPAELNNFHLFYAFSKRQQRRYYERSLPKMTTTDMEKCLQLLAQRMLAEAEALPALYRELAIGVDVMLDRAIFRKVRKQWAQESTWILGNQTSLVVLREVLWHRDKPLFGKCYRFDEGKKGFWIEKTVELMLELCTLGDLKDLKEVITQFAEFSPKVFPPTPSLTLSDIREAGISDPNCLETLQIRLAELLMKPGLIQLPGGLPDSLKYAQCLAQVLVRFGVIRGPERVINNRKAENAIRSVLGSAEFAALRNAEFSGQIVTLKSLFGCYFAFLRSTNTTFMHYLSKREELKDLLRASCSGFNADLSHFIDKKGRCCLGVAAYYGNKQGIEVLLDLNWQLPAYTQGLSPILLSLEGLRYSYKVKRRQMKEVKASDDELERRFQCFKLLHRKLPVLTESPDIRDDSGYDSLFSAEKQYMRGTPESRYGYPMLVAVTHYKMEHIKEMLSMGLSPCAVHRYSLQTTRKVDKKLVKEAKEVLTCPLKQSLLRCRPAVASLIISEIALKYPNTVPHQA
jgi:hypothetical protein